MDLNGDFRIQILVRRRGESCSDSLEIKTENCLDSEEMHEKVRNFINDTLLTLEEEDGD